MKIDSFSVGISSYYTIYGRSNNKIESHNFNIINYDYVVQGQEYKLNLEALKEQARIRNESPLIKLVKNKDGTILMSVEERNSHNIDWSALNMDLMNHSNSTPDSLDKIGYDIDYFASEYAQYKTRIMDVLIGDEQTASIQKIENLFHSRVQSMANRFSEIVGGFMDENGVSNEKERIKNSIIDIFKQRVGQYLGFIQQNDNYAELEGTDESWLLSDGIFMGEQLRYSFVSQNSEMNLSSEAGYSVDELTSAAILVKEAGNIKYKSSMSEEEFAANHGILGMEHELIKYKYDISEEVKVKLDTLCNQFVNNKCK